MKKQDLLKLDAKDAIERNPEQKQRIEIQLAKDLQQFQKVKPLKFIINNN